MQTLVIERQTGLLYVIRTETWARTETFIRDVESPPKQNKSRIAREGMPMRFPIEIGLITRETVIGLRTKGYHDGIHD